MQVNDILRTKGQSVHSVQADMSLLEAVDVLSAKNIGAVLVHTEGKPVCGILSERDIVRHIAQNKNADLSQPVSTLMTETVVTSTPEATLDDVMTIMSERRIRHVPIVDGNTLCGLVSIGDVVKRKISQSEEEAEALRQYISAAAG